MILEAIMGSFGRGLVALAPSLAVLHLTVM